jgi:hypothetical protein
VQITSDGHWAKLLRNSAGQLVASSGDRDEGTWKVVDVSDMNGGPTYQLNFVIPVIGGTAISIPTFAKSVTRMYLDNNGVYAANYVPTSEQVVPASSGPLPPPPGSDPLAACSTPANGTANPATQQEFVTRIVGTWLVCSQPTFFGTAELGVQITSDGHWAKLLRNSAGQLVASSGDRDEGTWKVVDVSDMNGGPTYQLNFVIPAIGGTAISIPTFAKSVTRMYLDNNGVYAANYVPTSEQVVPAN